MKRAIKYAGLIVFGVAFAVGGCTKKHFTNWNYIKDPVVARQLKSFEAEKEAQADSATNEAAPEYAAFFTAAKRGDWLAFSNVFAFYQNHVPQYQHSGTTDEHLRGTKWQTVLEIWGALDAFAECNEKYSSLYANDIIQSIPAGSIYFGGTGPGRFLITAMQKSQVDGDPFFTLTQNALADGTYLDYLRSMYGGRIYIPSPEQSQKCFDDYEQDAKERKAKKQLLPGENVKIGADGKVYVSGQVSVMQINGLLAKLIFDKNPNQDFYFEESKPIDWMRPYLEPNGLIFRINRQPLTTLSDEIVQQDHDYWMQTISPMIGDWLNDDATVEEIAAFADKVFLRHDFHGFKGDPVFVLNTYSHLLFSNERDSIAWLYLWRARHATNASEKQRMYDAADFAFRQAWALCPDFPPNVYGYVQVLKAENRTRDALLVAETAAKFRSGPWAGQFDNLISNLKRSTKSE